MENLQKESRILIIQNYGYQRSEVSELSEPFKDGQKGSSAMPHKKNPISSERITGLARVVRGYALSSMENMVLWHERDISNSSVERIVLPDSFNLLCFITKDLISTHSCLKHLNTRLWKCVKSLCN